MIQKMYRENAEDAKNSGVSAFTRLREAITATLKALADGRIKPGELPIGLRADPKTVRYAPGYVTVPPAERLASSTYTIDGLAKFLGEVRDGTEHATDVFRATFGAMELIDGKEPCPTSAQYAVLGVSRKNSSTVWTLFALFQSL